MVTDQLVEDYRRDGAVVVRGAFSADNLVAAEAGTEAVLSEVTIVLTDPKYFGATWTMSKSVTLAAYTPSSSTR